METKDFYRIAAQELENGTADAGLLAQAIAESNGNSAMVASRYLKLRASELARFDFDRKMRVTKTRWSEFVDRMQIGLFKGWLWLMAATIIGVSIYTGYQYVVEGKDDRLIAGSPAYCDQLSRIAGNALREKANGVDIENISKAVRQSPVEVPRESLQVIKEMYESSGQSDRELIDKVYIRCRSGKNW